jgi:putative transposase
LRNPSPHLKLIVLGAIDYAPGNTIRARIKEVSQRTFTDERGRPWRFTWRTIESWWGHYRKHGRTVPQARSRSDKGRTRKVELEAVAQAIEQVLPGFHDPAPAKAQVYRACLERGLLRRDQIAPNTFNRLVVRNELLQPHSEQAEKCRQAFSKQFANQMWQVDTLCGPCVKDGKLARPTRLICFIDDASRVIPHGEFFFSENAETFIQALKMALYKRGLPEHIYTDRGSVYICREIVTICARLGIILTHAPVRDGAAKGKIERFFRNVRESFLVRQLDLSSLESINRQFTLWVEEEYHNRVHSTLQMRPIDRFGLDLARLRFLPPHEVNDELFFVEESRQVKKDNTFSFFGRRLEAPRDLRGRKIQVRFDRHQPQRVIVFYKEQRMGQARLLDPVANDRPPKALAEKNAGLAGATITRKGGSSQ